MEKTETILEELDRLHAEALSMARLEGRAPGPTIYSDAAQALRALVAAAEKSGR